MPYTPKEIADTLGTTTTTVRRWSVWFADHLSSGATPPAGQRREFSETDLAMLRRAKALLDRGLTSEQVNEQLAVMPAEEEAEEPPPGQPEEEPPPEQAASSALVVWQAHQHAIDTQGRLIADQAERLTQQAGQLATQREQIADLQAQLEELRRQVEESTRQRRFRWPWEPRE